MLGLSLEIRNFLLGGKSGWKGLARYWLSTYGEHLFSTTSNHHFVPRYALDQLKDTNASAGRTRKTSEDNKEPGEKKKEDSRPCAYTRTATAETTGKCTHDSTVSSTYTVGMDQVWIPSTSGRAHVSCTVESPLSILPFLPSFAFLSL